MDFVFVDHASYQRPGGLYGDAFGTYGDNQFRFTLLSHAACEAPLCINFQDGVGACHMLPTTLNSVSEGHVLFISSRSRVY